MAYLVHQKFITAVAAVSIMITGFAVAPARADSDDMNRALLALLGVAIVGAVIHDRKRDDDRVHRPQVQPHPHKRPHIKPYPKPHVKPRPVPSRVHRKLLPAQCLRTIHNRRGQRIREFGLRCMRENYRHVNRLPQYCVRKDRTHKGIRMGYEVRCLRDAGYRLARR